LIHCTASDQLTKKRLAQRAAEGTDLSDGRWEIFLAQQAAYEPVEEIPSECFLKLSTDASVEQLVRESERFLRSRLETMA
jgi:predicted kinase